MIRTLLLFSGIILILLSLICALLANASYGYVIRIDDSELSYGLWKFCGDGECTRYSKLESLLVFLASPKNSEKQ